MAYIPKSQQAKAKAAPKKSTVKSKKDIPLSSMVDTNSSASIRKIENGYLVSESGYVGKGKNQQYRSREFFSASNPLESVGKVKFGKK